MVWIFPRYFIHISLCCQHKRDFVMLIADSEKFFTVPSEIILLLHHMKCEHVSVSALWKEWIQICSEVGHITFIYDLGKIREKHFWGLYFLQLPSCEAFAAMLLSGCGHISWWL